MTFKSDLNPQVRGFYFSQSGRSDLDGTTFARPKATMQQAIDAAASLVPPPSSAAIAVVSSAQGGSFANGFILSDSIQFNGQNVSINTTDAIGIELASFLDCSITSLVNTTANGICFNVNGKQSVGIGADFTGVFGTNGIGLNVVGSCDNLFFELSQISVANSGGIGINITATSPTPIDINTNTVSLDANNTTFFKYNPPNSTDTCVINVSSIDRNGFTGTKGFVVDSGHLIIVGLGELDAIDAIEVKNGAICTIFDGQIIGSITVDAGGTLNCEILEHTGVLTNNGTIVGRIGATNFSLSGAIETIIDFSPGIETTSGSVPLVKTSIVIPAVDATFVIEGSAMVSFSNVQGHSVTRLFNRTDLSAIGRQWEVEQEDASDILSPVFRQEFVQTIAAGAKTIELQYFVGTGNGTVSISDGLLTANEVISV